MNEIQSWSWNLVQNLWWSFNFFGKKLHHRCLVGFKILFWNRINPLSWHNSLKIVSSNLIGSSYSPICICYNFVTLYTAQKNKFSTKDFFSKCDQIRSFLRIWSYLLKKFLMEKIVFCVALYMHLSRVSNRNTRTN